MQQFSCDDAKQLDLVEYLASLNFHPAKVRDHNYWYLSPLRQENTASFKVDRQKQLWFDFGTGKGGDLITFGTLYHNCNVKELLQRLSQYTGNPAVSFHPPVFSGSVPGVASNDAGEKKDAGEGKIVVLDVRQLASRTLIDYLEKRCIPVKIADQYCKEVDFFLYGKKHTVIGFPNNSGGFELRNRNFKGSSSPKDITFINNNQQLIAVFEGFFSYLSFQTLSRNEAQPQANFLILNSLSFFEKSRQLMEQHREVHLLLDRDSSGIANTQKALEWNDEKYIDRSDFYSNCKDLNDWLMDREYSLSQSQSRGRRL